MSVLAHQSGVVERFRWTATDVGNLLPSDWRQQLVGFAISHMKAHTIVAGDHSSREADRTGRFPTLVVAGKEIEQGLPWLTAFYRGQALSLMQGFYQREKLLPAADLSYGINLLAAFETDSAGAKMRYERHVDWSPIGLLYATSQPAGAGGDLVISDLPEAAPQTKPPAATVRIYPVLGQFVCMDARKYPHHVEPLTPAACEEGRLDGRPFRLVVVMVFCTEDGGSCPESSRPADLDRHIGIDQAS